MSQHRYQPHQKLWYRGKIGIVLNQTCDRNSKPAYLLMAQENNNMTCCASEDECVLYNDSNDGSLEWHEIYNIASSLSSDEENTGTDLAEGDNDDWWSVQMSKLQAERDEIQKIVQTALEMIDEQCETKDINKSIVVTYLDKICKDVDRKDIYYHAKAFVDGMKIQDQLKNYKAFSFDLANLVSDKVEEITLTTSEKLKEIYTDTGIYFFKQIPQIKMNNEQNSAACMPDPNPKLAAERPLSVFEAPRCKSHKVVRAFQITEIEAGPEDGWKVIYGTSSTFNDAAPKHYQMTFDAEFVLRHNPQVGMYIVAYDDSYVSVSPQRAFEEGYRSIPGAQIKDLNQIDLETQEGRLLWASLIYFTTEFWTDKTPYAVLDHLSEFAEIALPSNDPDVHKFKDDFYDRGRRILETAPMSTPKKRINLTFGQATSAAKKGYKVARAGWNGSGMYAVIMPGYPEGIDVNEATAKTHNVPVGTKMIFRPYWQLKTAQNDIAMWAPSGSDSLAEDWMIVLDSQPLDTATRG